MLQHSVGGLEIPKGLGNDNVSTMQPIVNRNVSAIAAGVPKTQRRHLHSKGASIPRRLNGIVPKDSLTRLSFVLDGL